MRSAHSPAPGSASSWRFPRFTGLFFDEFASDSAWIRETAVLRLPPYDGALALTLHGEFRPHPEARGIETRAPMLECRIDGARAARLAFQQPGPFETALAIPAESARCGAKITLRLHGTALTNTLAWLGRVTGLGPLQRFRAQNKNRQIRIASLSTVAGETIFDFSVRLAPYSMAFARRHTHLGLNIVGFLTADLGIGESARCMVRAADAAGLPNALVPLKLNCKNRLGDPTYAARLQATNPHRVNVIHIDAPAARDLDHHHGPALRLGKYNIGYFAWELPEFPDSWVPAFAYFDEIWCPSDFVRDAVAMKSPLPVLTMPHAISFARPTGDFRARFGLPADAFLFLFLYDLNSYSERKNPQAVIEAFRKAALASEALAKEAALVIKVQNADHRPDDFAALQAAVRDLPGTIIIAKTLAREEIYQLESACDCFVTLHRSEGFGIAPAECMYLGKPVIATNWSGTTEFIDDHTGCPVNCTLATIQKNHGPYFKGQTWAEPDVEHAADWMRKLCADRTLAHAIGAAGRAAIEARFSPAAIGARYRRRLESIATF
jgi:glycosyltransferase involved in cell wall biosynthesis